MKRAPAALPPMTAGRAQVLSRTATPRRIRERPPTGLAIVRRCAGPGVPLLLMLTAVLVWTLSLETINPVRMGDTGLVSVLPAAAYVALAITCMSFALVLRRPQVSTPLVLLHIALLVFMLYGATALIAKAPSFNVVWRHAGVTSYIAETGHVDPHIDAYFNWPGFFFWAGLVTHVAGEQSVLQWTRWSAVVFELAYLAPLVAITRAFTPDRRLAWSAVWIFYLTNWVGQDYFSPQAMAYLWYLAVAAVALTYLSRRGTRHFAGVGARGTRLLVALRLRAAGCLRQTSVPPASAAQRAALVLVCVVIAAATVASHQLTPWMMIGGIGALVLFGRLSAPGLPLIILLLVGSWLSYVAVVYLGGHLKLLLGQTLNVNSAVGANVGNRLAGSPGHELVVHLRLAATAGLWLLATAGLVRGLRAGRSSPGHGLLALSSPLFVLIQPYGGEMLLRVYLFSLPFTACYTAQALAPRHGRWRDLRGAATMAVVGVLLLGGFLYTRYGNDATTIFTPREAQAAQRLYQIAPRGSLLVAASTNVAWRQQNYADYDFKLLGHADLPPARAGQTPSHLASEVAVFMQSSHRPAYLLLTRAQLRYDELMGSEGWGSVRALRAGAVASSEFVKVFDNGDAQIFKLRERGK
jgi:hypothetical protein